MDIFVALTELQKKLLHTLYHKKHAKFYFRMKNPHKKFLDQKKQSKIFICTWHEHSTITSSWMLKCNASCCCCRKDVNITEHVVITFQKPHLTIQVHETREKNPNILSAGPNYGLRLVKKFCTHVQVRGVVNDSKERAAGVQCELLLAGSFIVLC